MTKVFDDDPLLRCPNCGHVADLDGFDVCGADPGKLFCTQCHHEDEMEEVEMPTPDVIAEEM